MLWLLLCVRLSFKRNCACMVPYTGINLVLASDSVNESLSKFMLELLAILQPHSMFACISPNKV